MLHIIKTTTALSVHVCVPTMAQKSQNVYGYVRYTETAEKCV